MDKREMWDKRYAGRELTWSAGPNKLIEEKLGGLLPGKALDIACGEGRHAIWLGKLGWAVDGYDFSATGIARAREIAAREGVQVNLWVGDATCPAAHPSHYDLVLIAYLHTGPDERRKWMAQAVKAVAPGGLFAYLGHDPRNIKEGTGGPQNPAYLPDAEELANSLRDGFDIIEAGVVERPVGGEPGHGGEPGQTALDTFVLARRC